MVVVAVAVVADVAAAAATAAAATAAAASNCVSSKPHCSFAFHSETQSVLERPV